MAADSFTLLKTYSAVQVVAYYRTRMQIEEGFRDTKSVRYGLDWVKESRIQSERRATLLLIAALIIFAFWLVGTYLKGSKTERPNRVNTGKKPSPYSVIFLARIACHSVAFELPDTQIDQAQNQLAGYLALLQRN